MTRRQLELYRTSVVLPGPPAFRISVLDIGKPESADTPTVLFLHGAAGNMMQWVHQLTYFQNRMRVVAVEMRGHGLSEYPPPANFELDEFVADLEVAVELLKIPKPFLLVGHSFGGAVAAGYAARHSNDLKGLVLIATSGKIHLRPSLTYLLKMPAFMLSPIQKGFHNSVSATPHVLKKLIPYVARWRGWDLYPNITCPALGIAGEWDLLTRPASMQDMMNKIPGGWLERISFAGHLPQLDRSKRVNQLLEDFFFPEKKVNWRGASAQG